MLEKEELLGTSLKSDDYLMIISRMFDDRIEIWGGGSLPEPLTTDDLKKEHKSVLRNPALARSFFLIKFIEQWRTGTNEIIKGCLAHDLPEAEFKIITDSLVVIIRK